MPAPLINIYTALSNIQANKQDPEAYRLMLEEAEQFNMIGESERAHMAAEFSGDQMLAGYIIGLETARALLAQDEKAKAAGVTF